MKKLHERLHDSLITTDLTDAVYIEARFKEIDESGHSLESKDSMKRDIRETYKINKVLNSLKEIEEWARLNNI